jgi:hypothetical protein
MYDFRKKSRFAAASLILLLVTLLVFSSPAAAYSSWEVVASGLDNPRGLAFGPGGALFVAEAGSGGDGPCIPDPEGGERCLGFSGAITRISNGSQERIITGLPSLAGADGSASTGPTDVGFRGRAGWVITGFGGDPADRALLGPAGEQFGRLVRITDTGKAGFMTDVAAYEALENPDGSFIDTNPYALQIASGLGVVVADAGANALIAVKDGPSTLAVFPARLVDAPPFLGLPPGTQIPMESVPNAITQGPDGALYVGELTGFPFQVGGARVYRVVPGEAPEVVASGFTNIIDLAFGPDGHLYVLEIVKERLLSGEITGALVRVEADGSHTEIASEGLVAPTGLAIAADGAIYISNFGIFPGAGQVVKITP